MTTPPGKDNAAQAGGGRLIRRRILVAGSVQGVGFRPFVHRLAAELGLAGWAANGPPGVQIEVEGTSEKVGLFEDRLCRDAPPLSYIMKITAFSQAPLGEAGFAIRPSQSGPGAPMDISFMQPDLAACAACLRELRDPGNRRYRYPFITCTECGPRYSIIERNPFDRAHTTMKGFVMCPACRAEYEDPADRRFHAETISCSACGPRLALWDCRGNSLARDDDALCRAASAVRDGRIVAVKGLGGFHLLASAVRDDAVARLRERKGREAKPLAVLVADLQMARRHSIISAPEEALLCSPASPIVLLRRRLEPAAAGTGSPISELVAPGNPYLGLILPYTPLHALLAEEIGQPVVATSGNPSDEILCTEEELAVARLGDVADLFLVHNRPIARPVEDSVAQLACGRPMLLRRARGYVPQPTFLRHEPDKHPSPVLAVGAQQKSTIAAGRSGCIVLSEHHGDLGNAASFASFQRSCRELPALLGLQPALVASDFHPDYLSTFTAERLGLPRLSVQHHHAHVLACMAEHGLAPPLLGVAWDGSGAGPDGIIWGGEFFRVSPGRSCPSPSTDRWTRLFRLERMAYFRPFPLPGAELAIRTPWRAALGLLFELQGGDLTEELAAARLPGTAANERSFVLRQLNRAVHTPRTTSAGRLFDTVAALLGIRLVNTFEGQGAMELQFAAMSAASGKPFPYGLRENGMIDWGPLVQALLQGREQGTAAEVLAADFHATLAEIIVDMARRAGLREVVLSGGCFQNALLLEWTARRLREEGFVPHWPQAVPPNDGGIAFGQAYAALLELNRSP